MLSKYERRVLEEFETEFKAARSRRRCRSTTGWLGAGVIHGAVLMRRQRSALLCAVAGFVLCALVIVFVATTVAACVATVVGSVTGGLVVRSWRPRARTDPH